MLELPLRPPLPAAPPDVPPLAPDCANTALLLPAISAAATIASHDDGRAPEGELLCRGIQHPPLAGVAARLQLVQRNAEAYRQRLGLGVQPFGDLQRRGLERLHFAAIDRKSTR